MKYLIYTFKWVFTTQWSLIAKKKQLCGFTGWHQALMKNFWNLPKVDAQLSVQEIWFSDLIRDAPPQASERSNEPGLCGPASPPDRSWGMIHIAQQPKYRHRCFIKRELRDIAHKHTLAHQSHMHSCPSCPPSLLFTCTAFPIESNIHVIYTEASYRNHNNSPAWLRRT